MKDRKLEIRDNLLANLQGVMKYRRRLRHLVERPDGRTEAAWKGLERHAMMNAVNRVRRTHGFKFVELEDIERIELGATGADYASKVALRCAELAITP